MLDTEVVMNIGVGQVKGYEYRYVVTLWGSEVL